MCSVIQSPRSTISRAASACAASASSCSEGFLCAAHVNQCGQQQQYQQVSSRGELIESGAGSGGGDALHQLRQVVFKQGFAP